MTLLSAAIDTLASIQPRELCGTVAAVRGLTILVDDLPLPVGALVRFESPGRRMHEAGHEALRGEVVGFDGARCIVMLFGHSTGIAPGMRVIGEQSAQTVGVGDAMLGRVLDGFARPIDHGPPLLDLMLRPLQPRATQAMRRSRIREPLPTGLRAVDGFLTIGRGQRMGIFSAAGVGKSTLMGQIARGSTADVNVIALIGERGREVREFIEESLGPRGLARSVVVVATGDESPLMRVRAALTASTIAEHFRDEGRHVLLMMDSVTRFAQAQRQIGLTVGEPPATRGFTPSVFASLPVLLERAGAVEGGGSITGFYAVLVEGDDLDEPVSDTVRGVLDGHMVLSRRLASQGHFPPIDLLSSISRLATDVCDRHHVESRRTLLRLLSAYAENEELITIGAYARGSNAECDAAIALRPRLQQFLRQGVEERADYPATCRTMIELCGAAEQLLSRPATGASGVAATAQPASVNGAARRGR